MKQFEKVSFEQFKKDCLSLQSSGALWFAGDDQIRAFYDAIQLPRRATNGSAGYDFYSPFDVSVIKDNPVTIPTGIRVIIPSNTFLMCVPRSGLGFKYGMRLRNSVGIIDSSYSQAENEGHIMAKISTEESFKIAAGDRFMQGIIIEFTVTDDDDPISAVRTGGFGSTGGSAA